jgi:hypothetical protein
MELQAFLHLLLCVIYRSRKDLNRKLPYLCLFVSFVDSGLFMLGIWNLKALFCRVG